MAHVTFIHGILNKPPKDALTKAWRRSLTQGPEPLDLAENGVTSHMVYWADVLYENPEAAAVAAAAESIETGLPESVELPAPANEAEARFMEELQSHYDLPAEEGAPMAPTSDAAALEAVPAPAWVKKRFLNAYLRDVHHYLFNSKHSPRPGDEYRVQDEIRDRFITVLTAEEVSRPHVVVSHSMGTVIAYDCLKRVDACPAIDALITVGSPLGLDEIQEQLVPGWTRDDGFPGKVDGPWVNVFDRLDPVCGFDAHLANDYKKNRAKEITDIAVHNSGWWRHNIDDYLRQPPIPRALRDALGL